MNAARSQIINHKSAELTKALGHFFDNWSCNSLKAHLIFLFSYAAKGGIEDKEGLAENIALLFDQLIDLVAAAEALRQEGGAVSGSESGSISSSSSLTGQEGGAHD